MQRFATLTALLLFFALGAQTASAQFGLITCQATASPPVVRTEGLSEIVGDIVLTCTGPTITSGLGSSIQTDLSVSLNVNITNNIDFGDGSDVTDAVLIVNENNCTTPAAVGTSFACAGSDPRFQDPQLGERAATNRLEWPAMAFPIPGADDGFGGQNPDTTTIRITGIRGNASQLGVPSAATFPSTQVTAFVSITGPATIPITNNVLNVGVPILGVTTEVTGLVDDQFGLVVHEQFSNALLTRGTGVFSPSGRLSESSYFAPGSNNGAGASSGTRIMARFFNMADGATISLPRQVEYGSPQLQGDAIHLSLVPDSDSNGAGGAPTALTGQHDVALSGGFGSAVYEVVDASPSVTESVVIPVTFGAGGVPVTGQVAVSLAPLSTVVEASEPSPEPRFLDNSGDPQPVSTSPGATTPISARLQGIPQNDTGEFSVSVGATQILDGPVGSFGSTDVARGTTVAVAVSAGAGTSILNYETKITCVGGGLTLPVIASFADTAPAPRSLSLDVPAGGGLPVECSVLNRNTSVTPPTTTVDVALTVLPDLDLGMFEVSVDGSPVASGGDGAAGATSVNQGDTIVIAQTALAGTTLTDYGTTIVCLGGGLQGIAAASFQPGDAQTRSLTFDAPPNSVTPMRCDVRNLLGDLPSPPPVIPGLLTTCVATAVPTVVRAEGIAELAGDIVLACTPAPGENPGIADIPATLGVSLNVNVTNNIDFGEGPSMTDAVLVVNENHCTTPSAVGSNFTCGPDARFQAPQYGKLVAPDRVEWQNFTFPVPAANSGGGSYPNVTTVRITGIRARAEQLGAPGAATFPSTQVTAFVTINGATIPVTNNVLNVAVPIIGLIEDLDSGNGNDMTLTLDEGFATSFKVEGSPSFRTGDDAAHFEAGYYAPGSNGGDGAASGTRILVRFFGLDSGAAVSVPMQIDNGTSGATGDGVHLALVTGHGDDGAGGAVTSATGNANVPFTDGGGVAIYEVLDADPFRVEEITIPITFNSGTIGSGLVSANLAPLSSEVEASASAPEPRFRESPIGAEPPLGPSITNVTVTPEQGDRGISITLTADITDPDGIALASVILRPTESSFAREYLLAPAGGSLFSATIGTGDFAEDVYDVDVRAVDGGTPPFVNRVNNAATFTSTCSYGWNHSASFNQPGGPGMVTVTSGFCAWHLTIEADWITLTGFVGGQANYDVAPNPLSEPRIGVIAIRRPDGTLIGLHTVTQAGLPPMSVMAGTYASGLWTLDVNGNGTFDGGTDRSFALGFPGAQHFVGDWNGDGEDEVGVYANGFWFLDFDGDGNYDGGTVDKQFSFGFIGATPVVGDWNGDGATEVGVYNAGFWFLDLDGSMTWDGGVNDGLFPFGWPGVEILIGDWNGDGRDKVGVFSNGFWFLDYDGDTLWDGGTTDKQFGWGWAGVTPIVGDWDGDGRDQAGAWTNGFWLLDYDGDNLWDGGTTDRLFGWGAQTSTPVIGDWDGDGSDSAGAFLDGEWVLDVNGDALWDGGTVDQLFNWGTAGDEPVVGRW